MPKDTYEEIQKKERNRKETRVIKTFHDITFIDRDKWQDLIQMVIQVQRITQHFDTTIKDWRQSEEISYYVATKILPAKESAQAIRNHWGIENRNHYVKDVSMKEDFSRIRKNPHIMAKLRSFALNIMRIGGAINISTQLYLNCLNIHAAITKYSKFLS